MSRPFSTRSVRRPGPSLVGRAFVLVFVVLSGLAAASPARAAEALCDAWHAAADQMNAATQIWIDPVTRWDGMTVHCADRRVLFRHFVRTPEAGMLMGWQDRMRRHWQDGACNDQRLAASFAAGWTLADIVTFADGEVVSLRLACPSDGGSELAPS